MRSLFVLALCICTCLTLVSSMGLFPPRSRPIAIHTRTNIAPQHEGSYPGLITTNNLTQYTIGQILNNSKLVGDTHNISWVFNISTTHLGHMPWLEKELNATGGNFTMFVPDDVAMMESKPRWEAFLKEKYNLTTPLDIGKIWNMTEHSSEPGVKESMEWTHAGIAWSIVQGNHSLHNLSSENLLPTMLYPNISHSEQFVALGNNHSQFIRIIKGDNVTVYGVPILEALPTMKHDNRTDVMVVSGSGHEIHQIGHVYHEILASNGRIYIVDRAVDIPLNTTDMLKVENATLFLAGISKSGFNDTVNNTPNMTILVPTDSAIMQTMKDYEISNETHHKWNQEQIKAILTPYIINGTFYEKDLNTTSTLHSIGGHTLNITHVGNHTLINQNVSIIQTNVLTRNGVIHIINDTFRQLERKIIDTLPK